MKKILLISDYAPTESNSGGIVMLEQLAFLKKYYLMDVLIYNSERDAYKATLQKGSHLFERSKLGENQPRVINRFLKRQFEFLFNVFVLTPWVRNEAKKLQLIIDNGSYESIFITIQGLYLAKVVNRVRFAESSVVLQYWDPDAWWALRHNFSPNGTRQILKEHKTLEEKKSVRKIIVPSRGMAKALNSRSANIAQKLEVFYPTDTFYLYKAEAPTDFNFIRERHKKLLVFSGAIYALPEIVLMIETVSALNAKIPGIDLGFVMIGASSSAEGYMVLKDLASKNASIYLFGRITPAEVESCLSLADVIFLPYPFWSRQLVEESFPSKFSKYIGSKKPILVLAPNYSSLTKMLLEVEISHGLVTVLSKTNLMRELHKILAEPQACSEQLKKLNILQRKYFGSDARTKTLGRIFNLENNTENYGSSNELVYVDIKPLNDFIQNINDLVRRLSSVISHKTLIQAIVHLFNRNLKSIPRKSFLSIFPYIFKRIRNRIIKLLYLALILIIGQEKYRRLRIRFLDLRMLTRMKFAVRILLFLSPKASLAYFQILLKRIRSRIFRIGYKIFK